jgi:hypothetical protein
MGALPGAEDSIPKATATPKMNVAVDGENFRWGRETMKFYTAKIYILQHEKSSQADF